MTGRKSTDSDQSLGSISGSVISGTTITSGGHPEDVEVLAASPPVTPTLVQRAINTFSQFLLSFSRSNSI